MNHMRNRTTIEMSDTTGDPTTARLMDLQNVMLFGGPLVNVAKKTTPTKKTNFSFSFHTMEQLNA